MDEKTLKVVWLQRSCRPLTVPCSGWRWKQERHSITGSFLSQKLASKFSTKWKVLNHVMMKNDVQLIADVVVVPRCVHTTPESKARMGQSGYWRYVTEWISSNTSDSRENRMTHVQVAWDFHPCSVYKFVPVLSGSVSTGCCVHLVPSLLLLFEVSPWPARPSNPPCVVNSYQSRLRRIKCGPLSGWNHKS